MKFELKYDIHRKGIWKCHLQNTGHFFFSLNKLMVNMNLFWKIAWETINHSGMFNIFL